MKTSGSKTGSLHIWLKEFWRFPVAIWRHMSSDPSRSGQNTSGFNSLYLHQSGCWCSIKRTSLAQGLVYAAPTGSSCHLWNVKIISWIGLNEKLMDFKGERGSLSSLYTQENGPPCWHRGHQRGKVSAMTLKISSIEDRCIFYHQFYLKFLVSGAQLVWFEQSWRPYVLNQVNTW